MTLVESIPLYLKYKSNATFGIPLEQAWRDLISQASHSVNVVSFYWTLTGEDINVNSSTDILVSSSLRNCSHMSKMSESLLNVLWKTGKGHPTSSWGTSLQEHICPCGEQCSHSQNKLHRSKDPKTERFDSYSFLLTSHSNC